jgi:transient receptor potential cation channel subfamily M protein 8
MKMIMQWNQLEMARNEIFTGQERFKAAELCELLEIALVSNKPNFVKLRNYKHIMKLHRK